MEAGRTVKDVCREAGISEASYYNWKAKLRGTDICSKHLASLLACFVASNCIGLTPQP
ncbi:Low calcium response locus protein S [Erwinia piriflorinigrans CFBP 5888]|uniref:Low calcium response locus protein S n=1 Tax=Erwinia piriflorinigrans CFBP 5888 TaxID=1161919 RepID=V5Z6Y8_9GAMM|nr:Low calcium response locus protein S [Erwinia piriflorinigrans CFBP 5888]